MDHSAAQSWCSRDPPSRRCKQLTVNHRRMTVIDRTHQAARRATTRLLTTTAFLFAVVGQGFRPCPHHASLDGFGHGPVAQAHSPSHPLDGGFAGSPSESTGGHACLCIDGCDLGSESHLLSDPTWSSSPLPSPRSPAPGWQSRTDLPEQNVHLIPLAQPPPHGVAHLI